MLQEILHCYVSIKRRDAVEPASNALLGVIDQVFSVDQAAVEGARQIALGYPSLSVRDAVHLAVKQIHGVRRILSFERKFDGFPGVTRLS